MEDLPVYVRGGSILPIAPLTQSTAEIPDGPLTLRVYPLTAQLTTPGQACEGEVYSDDGHSFAYRKGAYARIHFACSTAADGSLKVTVAKQEGSWRPWWRSYRMEVVGWLPKQNRATVDGHPIPLTQVGGLWGVNIPTSSTGMEVELH